MDQAPGPIIAKVNPSTANAIGIPALPAADSAIHVSTPATTIPAMGVHRPAISKIPASAPMLFAAADAQTGAALRQPKSMVSSVAPTSNR